MKILVYGSTFNPIHKAHLYSIEYAYKKYKFDKVIIVPNYQGHFKNGDSIASIEDRLNMVKLALVELDAPYELSLIEVVQEKKIYTYDLIKQLQIEYPQADFTFLVGSDQAKEFDKWHRIDELKQMINFMVVKRDKNYTSSEYLVLDNEVLDYSSTKIRMEYATSGIDSVDNYIREHGLYLEDLVSHKMSSKRYRHVLNVADLAKKMAKRYHLDEMKAYISSMLHDICKEMPLEKQYELVANRENFEVNDATIHAFAAYYYGLEYLKIKDEVILNAIKWHTTAYYKMSAYDKLLYVSDMLSAERTFVGVDKLRALFNKDLNECFKQCFLLSYDYLIEKDVKISSNLKKLKEMIERNEV